MNLRYFLLINMLIQPLIYSQHIVDTSTKIKFNNKKKPVFEWIRDHKNGRFGNTGIIKTTTGKPPFVAAATIKTLTTQDFTSITEGHSFYCDNIKKEKKISYGVFVIYSNEYHFGPQKMNRIHMLIRNAYILHHILDDTKIKLEPSSSSNSSIDLQYSEETKHSTTTEEQ